MHMGKTSDMHLSVVQPVIARLGGVLCQAPPGTCASELTSFNLGRVW